MDRGILVYCIAERFDESLAEIRGIDEKSNLFAIRCDDLFALVSEVDADEYGEENMAAKAEDIDWLKEKAAAFMEILLKILPATTIIPMKFLTIFYSEERVKEVVTENLENFLSTLSKIRGHEELSVKIYCDQKKFKDSVMSEEISSFEKTLTGKPKGAAFFLKKKFEGELDEKIRNRTLKISDQIADDLSRIAVETRSNKILAKEITGIETPMVLNCAFLVATDKTVEFADSVREYKKQYEQNGFMIEPSGPWPPYSFC